MTILLGEYGHIKSRWDNHDKCIKCSSCSRESICSTRSSWSDKTWKLAKERRTCASRKWFMAKKKKRSQKAMPDSSDEEKLDGITAPHGPVARGRTHPGGNSKGTCTQRSVSPPPTGQPAISQPAIGNSPNGQEDIAQEFQVSQSPVTGHPATGRWTYKYQHRGKSIFTSHLSLVIRLYINLHLVRLMPWAWSTNNNSKRVLLPLEPDFSNTSDPSVVIEPPDNSWTTDKLYRLPSLDVFPGGISLEVNINPRRGGDVDRPLHPPLLGLHLQTLAKEAESQKDPNILTRKGEDIHLLLLHCLIISPMI